MYENPAKQVRFLAGLQMFSNLCAIVLKFRREDSLTFWKNYWMCWVCVFPTRCQID